MESLCPQERPTKWSIVYCRFPYDGQWGAPSKDKHPCLVIGWKARLQNSDDIRLWLAPGTSQRTSTSKKPIRPEKWHIEIPGNATSGLSKLTRFDLGVAELVSFSTDFFDCESRSPLVGCLVDAEKALAEAAKREAAKIWAARLIKPKIEVKRAKGFNKDQSSGQSTE